jgi:hypothetical protein
LRFDLSLAQARDEPIALASELIQHEDDFPPAYPEQAADLDRNSDDPAASLSVVECFGTARTLA